MKNILLYNVLIYKKCSEITKKKKIIILKKITKMEENTDDHQMVLAGQQVIYG